MRDIMSDVIDPTQREKIVKIGPVDPEIALLNLKKKRKVNIYSPVGKFAERTKNLAKNCTNF